MEAIAAQTEIDRRCWRTCPTRTSALRLSCSAIRARVERSVDHVLCGCAAYRTQLFLDLKACGREELSTMNLWAGMDAPAPA